MTAIFKPLGGYFDILQGCLLGGPKVGGVPDNDFYE